MNVETRDLKKIAVLGIKLEKYLKSWNIEEEKKEVGIKFTNVWGSQLAYHFLTKYDDAESMIWALDNENLELFITKF